MTDLPESTRDDATRLLSDLVSIQSVNPYFPGGDRGEADITSYVAEFTERAGLQVTRQDVLPGRANVVAELAVPGAERTLLFDSHVDTVSLDQMGDGGLRPEIRDGRLTGRGSCDDKASLAAMMIALRELARRPRGINANVILLASVDEEYLMRGARAFARAGRTIDGAIVGEPTGLDVVIAHKGFVRWQLHALGTAAHSSNPHLGANAIYHLADFIHLLRPEYDRLLAERHHPLVGPATWSIGKIWGGASVNIVPERCTVEVDRRLLPGETSKAALAEFDDLVQRICAGQPSLRVVRDEPFGDVAGLSTPASAAVVRAAEAACREIRGEAHLVGVAYGTNASKFAEVGIECVVLGPGDIRQAHTADEYVAIDQVVEAARIYEAAARRF
jgi:acetylornithine deacetylase/succinyl-diaminopimelate desuccinylase-like protein